MYLLHNGIAANFGNSLLLDNMPFDIGFIKRSH